MNNEHAWVLENLETFAAGGLDPAETERLNLHIASCPPCAAALAETRTLDQEMTTLFADVRPSTALEDRMLRALRTGTLRRNLRLDRFRLLAAVVLFGVVGFGVNSWIAKGELAFPSLASLSQNLPMPGRQLALVDRADSMRDQEKLSMPAAASSPAQAAGRPSGQDPFAITIYNGESSSKHTYTEGLPTIAKAGDEDKPSSASSTPQKDHAREPGWGLTGGWRYSDGVAQSGQAGESVADLAQKTRESLSTGLQQGQSVPVDGLPADQVNNLGYYPPSRALVTKGSSRFHFTPGGGTVNTQPNAENVVRRELSTSQVPGQTLSYPDMRQDEKSAARLDVRAKSEDGGKDASKDAQNKPIQNAYFGLDAQATSAKGQLRDEVLGGRSSGGSQLGLKVEEKLAGQKRDGDQPREIDQKSSEGKPEVAGKPISLGSPVTIANKSRGEARTAAEQRLEDAQKQKLIFEGGAIGTPEVMARAMTEIHQAELAVQKEKEEANRANQAQAARKIIIRTGDIEYEIESFDAAVAGITKIANAIPGAFIATVNSEKLPNGKVKGSVVVRIPPEHLDSFVLDIRKDLGKGGELKSLKIGSQDITKQYTDLESRLKAARTMEERLLLIIKNGKGEIKDLLATEKELGNWRTQIESIEGELRYFGNQVALSTLTISLYEREIKAPYGLVTTERVQMGIEVEEVDKALQTAQKAVSEVKGRITKSELKQHAAGQFSALLHFEVAPENSGPMRDRMRQLGTVTRLDADRLQEAEGGTGPALGAPVKEKDAQFQVSLYNIANVAPRESVTLNLACTDAETVYQTLLNKVRKTTGARVVTSNLNRQKNDQSTGTLNFEVKTSEADAMLAELKKAGEVLQLQFTENPDTQTVTRAKRGFNVQLVGMGAVNPRETTVLQIAAKDVPAAERALQNAVATVNGRVLNAQVNEQDRQNITAQLDFDIRRSELAQLEAALAQSGDVIRRDVTRAPEGDNVLDSKMRFQVALVAQSRIPARETTVLGIEVADVDTTKEAFEAMAKEKQGRVAASTIARERNGRVTAKMMFDMPLAAADALAGRFKSAGKVRVQQSSQNLQVPEGPLAIGRVEVTLSNEDLIVPSDEGLWPQVRKGLSTSFFALAWSLTVVIVGVCFVLPWGLVSYGGYRLWQRVRPKAPATN